MNKNYVVWDGVSGREVYFFTEEAARVYFNAAVEAHKNERHLLQMELVNGSGEVVDVLECAQFEMTIKEAV